MTYSDHPEFHPNGPIVRVSHPKDLSIFVDIHREGSALVFHDPSTTFENVTPLRSPEEFRKAFPDGKIPGDDSVDWKNNAWFDLYCGPDGVHLDVVTHCFKEALISAHLMVDTIHRNTCR